MDLEQFKHYVENDKGIFLGLIDFEKLLEIEDKEDSHVENVYYL